jgi:hypothetical protein
MTGVEMLISSVLKALKIDKDIVMEQIQDAEKFAKGADARVTGLEVRLDKIETLLLRIESEILLSKDTLVPAGIGAATENHELVEK